MTSSDWSMLTLKQFKPIAIEFLKVLVLTFLLYRGLQWCCGKKKVKRSKKSDWIEAKMTTCVYDILQWLKLDSFPPSSSSPSSSSDTKSGGAAQQTTSVVLSDEEKVQLLKLDLFRRNMTFIYGLSDKSYRMHQDMALIVDNPHEINPVVVVIEVDERWHSNSGYKPEHEGRRSMIYRIRLSEMTECKSTRAPGTRFRPKETSSSSTATFVAHQPAKMVLIRLGLSGSRIHQDELKQAEQLLSEILQHINTDKDLAFMNMFFLRYSWANKHVQYWSDQDQKLNPTKYNRLQKAVKNNEAQAPLPIKPKIHNTKEDQSLEDSMNFEFTLENVRQFVHDQEINMYRKSKRVPLPSELQLPNTVDGVDA
jgi:hypothetical protein